MNIIETNKLIAEFLEIPFRDEVYNFNQTVLYNIPGDHWHYGFYRTEGLMEFHYSWDWLMPVIEKIEKLGYGVVIHEIETDIFSPPGNSIITNVSGNTKLKGAYLAVVKFIEQWCIDRRIACELANYPQSEAFYDSITDYYKQLKKYIL